MTSKVEPPSEESIKSAMYRMKEGKLSPESAKISMMRWSDEPDEEYIDAVVGEAARRLGLEFEGEKYDSNKKFNLARDDLSKMPEDKLRLPLMWIKQYNYTPSQAKRRIMERLGNGNEQAVSRAVDEAARRLGLESNDHYSDLKKEAA